MLGVGDFTEIGSANCACVKLTGASNAGPSSTSGSDHTSNLYFQPGVTVLVPLGLLYVGADVNALIVSDVPHQTDSTGVNVAMTIHGQVGVRF
jgi:hypothetical protein